MFAYYADSSSDGSLVFLLLAVAGACALVGYLIGSNKGQGLAGALFGGLLGPLGVAYVIWGMDPTTRVQQAREQAATWGMKKCPACAEWVQGEAILCRYCGTDFPPENEADAVFPIAGYDSFTEDELIPLIGRLRREDVEVVANRERSLRARPRILAALDRAASRDSP